MCLEADDVLELSELLTLVWDWLGADPGLARSLQSFVGVGYGPEELRSDVARFIVVLGVDDEDALGAGR